MVEFIASFRLYRYDSTKSCISPTLPFFRKSTIISGDVHEVSIPAICASSLSGAYFPTVLEFSRKLSG